MFGCGATDINDLITNTVGACPYSHRFIMRYLLRVELAVKYKCGINQRQMMRLFEVTICDLKDGGINGKEGTGADNRYDQKLLEYYQPKILLGLTATPERMDGKSMICTSGRSIWLTRSM